MATHLRLEAERAAGDVRCLKCMVRCLTKPKPASQFRLWMDSNADPLPLRIELMPRSFLALTLQRIDRDTEPIPKENL